MLDGAVVRGLVDAVVPQVVWTQAPGWVDKLRDAAVPLGLVVAIGVLCWIAWLTRRRREAWLGASQCAEQVADQQQPDGNPDAPRRLSYNRLRESAPAPWQEPQR